MASAWVGWSHLHHRWAHSCWSPRIRTGLSAQRFLLPDEAGSGSYSQPGRMIRREESSIWTCDDASCQLRLAQFQRPHRFQRR
eukprot:1342767-Amorphochlora_amoeboformis.AAC.1